MKWNMLGNNFPGLAWAMFQHGVKAAYQADWRTWQILCERPSHEGDHEEHLRRGTRWQDWSLPEERPLMRVQPLLLWRLQEGRMTTKDSCSYEMELPWAYEENYVCCGCQNQVSGATQILWNSEDHEWLPDMRHWDKYTAGFCFCFNLIHTESVPEQSDSYRFSYLQLRGDNLNPSENE